MLVVVNPRKERDFLDSYFAEDAKNDTTVVPGSARKLNIDDTDNNLLYRVVVFQKHPNSTMPRQIGNCIARQFSYNKEEYLKLQAEKETLQKEKEALEVKMLKSFTVYFSQLYKRSLHLKIIRLFIDGVLRFGIPPQFLISAADFGSNEKKQITKLSKLYEKPGEEGLYGDKEAIGDSEDYYPFVIVPVTV